MLAVLESRAGLGLGGQDVYLNVAGGLRVSEPAADLAVAAALISSHFGVALPKQSILFGEISLSGSIRPVAQGELRLKEAEKLGFQTAMLPKGTKISDTVGLSLRQFDKLQDLVTSLSS